MIGTLQPMEGSHGTTRFLFILHKCFTKKNLGMKPNYNDLPLEFLGPGKGRLYDRKGTKRDVELPRLELPLVSRPFRVKNLRSEMDVTSQISREARDVMINNVYNGLGGVYVCLNRKRAREKCRCQFCVLYR